MQPQPAVTLEDLARNLGVSASTVSLALRNKPGVGDALRQRVLAEADRLGYRMRSPRTPPVHGAPVVKTVGVVIKARENDDPLVNDFYGRVLAGIEAACRSHRLHMLLGTVLVDAQNRALEIPALLEEGGADGLLAVGMQVQGELLAVMRRRHPALVLVDSYAPHTDDGGFDAVLSNNYAGGELAANHLLAEGHRHLAVLGAAANAYPSLRDRYHGFADTVESYRGAHLYSVGRVENQLEAATLFSSFLAGNPQVTACFGGNDLVAIAAMRSAQTLGQRVPEDFAVIGFDGIALGEHTSPPLTTLAVDKLKMGRVAVEMLLDRVAFPDAAPAVATITPRFIARGSAKIDSGQVNADSES
jgi:LacI family transcriptional regulator